MHLLQMLYVVEYTTTKAVLGLFPASQYYYKYKSDLVRSV